MFEKRIQIYKIRENTNTEENLQKTQKNRKETDPPEQPPLWLYNSRMLLYLDRQSTNTWKKKRKNGMSIKIILSKPPT